MQSFFKTLIISQKLSFKVFSKPFICWPKSRYWITPRPRTALLMFLEKYSAIGISAIGNYSALCSKT